MRKLFFSILLAIGFIFNGCVKDTENFVFVKGGNFVNKKSNLYGKNVIIKDFYIGKYEVTQKEWIEVMGYNPSKFKGDNMPVEMVTWYDCAEFCNRRSIKEGFKPYYNIDKNKKDPDNKNDGDSIKWMVTIIKGANGYRLPTEAEWEYAAGGGQKSKSYTYCGSNDVNETAWYWKNSGDSVLTGNWFWATIERNNCRTNRVGLKKPNELNLYDMSGNVREWCEEWYEDYETDIGYFRSQRGGGWIGGAHNCASYYRGRFEAHGKGPDQGFRLCYSR